MSIGWPSVYERPFCLGRQISCLVELVELIEIAAACCAAVLEVIAEENSMIWLFPSNYNYIKSNIKL